MFDRPRDIAGSHQEDAEVIVQIRVPGSRSRVRGSSRRLLPRAPGERISAPVRQGLDQMLSCRNVVWNGGKHLAKIGGRFSSLPWAASALARLYRASVLPG